MEQARWNRIEELLQAALDLDPSDRGGFLARVCEGDDELARELESLLAMEDGDPLESPLTLTGRTIDHYRVEAQIGAGGMGDVYRARDERLQRVVALKALPAEFTADPERVQRFEREALAASRLNHPNIITIFEIVRPAGAHFIATELVEGATLRELLKSGSVTLGRALDIAEQTAAALEAAHAASIIHRDIKPENVMVRSDGLVKVLDFGIAKLSEVEDRQSCLSRDRQDCLSSTTSLTMPGAVLGTASYMSPEQARGEPLDARTDLYSLGLVLREMVKEPPRDLRRIMQKLLRPQREERYASAAELLVDLRAFRRRLEGRTARRLIGISALIVVAAIAITAVAAVVSISEMWHERVLRDGHSAAARQAVFSPDGRLLVTGGEDGRIFVWDFAKRERLAAFSGPAHRLAFSPDGRLLASGGSGGAITIRNARSGERLRTLRMAGDEIGALAFSPDATLFAAAGSGGTTVWSTTRWDELRRWPAHTMPYGTLGFPAGSQQLLSSMRLTTFDLNGGGHAEREPLMSVNWMQLSSDGRLLVTVSSMGEVSFYRWPEAVLLARHRAHRDHGRSVAISPDDRLVASASEDILLWDASTRTKVARFEYSAIVWNVVFSPDGRWLVSTHGDGAVLVWDVAERERVANLNEHAAAVRSVSFAPDNRRVASAAEDRTVTLWDADHGRREAVLMGHETRVMSLSFSASGDQLASLDQDGVVILWDVEKRVPRIAIRPPAPTPAYSVAVSPDGRHVANFAGLFATSDGHALASFGDWRFNHPYGMAFSPDGRLLGAATPGSWVLLWNVETRQMLETRQVPGAHLIAIAFSPDGRRLVTGEDQGAVRLWSVRPLRELAVLGRHRARVKSVAFSPDGKTVASAGDDRMIALWDVARRRLRSRIGTHASPVYSVAFSPDGKRLVSGEHDRSVRVYTSERSLWGFTLP